MNRNRFAILLTAIILSASGPARGNSMHTEKGASNQGISTAANFQGSGPTVDGIPTTIFFNDNSGETFDVFTLPASFLSGTPITLTFNNTNGSYGIFDCDNGANNFAVSADSSPVPLVGPCTVGAVGSNDQFVSFADGVNSATLSFLGGAGSPSTFVLYAADGTLTGIQSGSGSTTVPEPGTLALVAVGLAGLFLLRRRADVLA